MLNDLSKEKDHIVYMNKLTSEQIEYALYPVKEIQDLYAYKVKYQLLRQQLDTVITKYPALKELLQTHFNDQLLDEE